MEMNGDGDFILPEILIFYALGTTWGWTIQLNYMYEQSIRSIDSFICNFRSLEATYCTNSVTFTVLQILMDEIQSFQ